MWLEFSLSPVYKTMNFFFFYSVDREIKGGTMRNRSEKKKCSVWRRRRRRGVEHKKKEWPSSKSNMASNLVLIRLRDLPPGQHRVPGLS